MKDSVVGIRECPAAERFRKRPIVIDAWQFKDHAGFDAWAPDWLTDRERVFGRPRPGDVMKELSPIDVQEWLAIHTLEGRMIAAAGDWIIRGVKGEIYPCKPDIFTETYEPAPAVKPASSPVREGALGWNSPEAWEIEQRAFHAAGRDDVPKDVQELVAILWKQYCIAAEPRVAETENPRSYHARERGQ